MFEVDNVREAWTKGEKGEEGEDGTVIVTRGLLGGGQLKVNEETEGKWKGLRSATRGKH